MRGVKSEDLVAIVDFLYYGEANVYQENIDSFLAIADELDLKGLTGNTDTKELDEASSSNPKPATNSRKHVSKTTKPKAETNQSNEGNETPRQQDTKATEDIKTVIDVPSYEVSNMNINDIQELDDQVKSMMRKSENLCADGSRKATMCTVCGKEGFPSQIKNHIEANHLEGVSIPCNYCDKIFRSRAGLRQHNTVYHK